VVEEGKSSSQLPFKGIITPIYVSFPGNYLEEAKRSQPSWQKLHLLKTLPPPAPFRNVFSLCRSDPRSSSGYTEKNKTQAAWSMNAWGLFQAGCENISQELHVVMSNLIFE